MKFLHVFSSIDPRGGGPIEGVRNLGQRLHEMGHEVELLTLDAPDAPWIAEHTLKVHALGPSAGRYRYNSRLVPWLRENARRYDLITVNGIWEYQSFGTWRALAGTQVPYVVFTHGMLDPWFKRAYPLKHLKKWLYWPWAEYRVLRDAAAVLFTCEEERRVARESFWLYKVREQVVSFGTRTPPQNGTALAERFLDAHPEMWGKRLLLFLGRIQEKKGCDLLIDAFASVAESTPDLHLVMAGPDQTGWAEALQAQARLSGVDHRVHWTGMLQGDLKWGAFHAAEAFVLPSHQENFGIAVSEALGCGLPVLISDKVNIWREVQDAGAGLVAADTVEGTRSMLTRWLSMDLPARRQMAQEARELFHRRFTVHAMAEGQTALVPLVTHAKPI